MEQIDLSHVLEPISFVVAGFLLGLFLEKVVLKRLEALAVLTRWRADNVIYAAFRGIPIFWMTALGIYAALRFTTSDEGVEAVLNDALKVSIVWSVTIVAARMAAGLTTTYANRTTTFLPSTSIIPNLIRLGVYAIGFLVVLNTLEVAIAPVLTALGVGGLAVALALQDTLANVFAGIYLLAARQVKPGDFVRLDSGEEGYVDDITWRSTGVRTIFDNLVIVPNAKLASAIVTNFNLPGRDLLLRIPVGVSYGAELGHVERVTAEAARATLRAVTGQAEPPEPLVLFQSFGEFSLNLVVLLRVREFFDQYQVRHVFIKTLVERYAEEGIDLPFPIREFQMELDPGAGPANVYPPDYRDEPAESNAPDAPDDL